MKADIKRFAPPALAVRKVFRLVAGNPFGRSFILLLLAAFLLTVNSAPVAAQRGDYAIWGEVKIDNKADPSAPLSITIILYRSGGGEVGRTYVSSGGRYRFTDLADGEYDVAALAGDNEVGRARISILPGTLSPFYGFRQDFDLEWKPKGTTSVVGVISAADVYTRAAANQSLFRKAQESVEKKKYEQAVNYLRQILDNDKQDFQVWTLLGTVYLVQENPAEAEKAYLKAVEARPTFAMALLHLGRLRTSQKRYEEAIEPLTRAVEAQPKLAEANLLLGEAYLQVKKGSKAIGYLEEAARLGRPEAHLRLAWLYNAAGLKDKAADEYEEFLKKKPDYPERKKLRDYISANKKS